MTNAYECQSAEATPRFEAVLYPNQSLGDTGFIILMAVIVLVSGLIGAGFALVGAWPVTGFLGLDVFLLYLAFRLHFRRSRRVDMISLDRNGLTVRRFSSDHQEQTWHFETAWVQVLLEDQQLKLRSHGKDLVIGTCLTADERRAFAQSLRSAIQLQRGKLVE